jgi:uncharacterized protein (TIGR03437 family)
MLTSGLAFGSLYGIATLMKRYAEDFYRAGKNLLDPDWIDIFQTAAIVISMALAWFTPRLGRRQFLWLENAFSRFANHRNRAIVLAGAFPLLVRLAVLPVLPVPEPVIADEFGNFLIADTFAHGRLTNPTHPMWTHFEETYIQHQPTYTSVYPVAQPLMLAVPMRLGIAPWVGVYFSVGLMCALICWAFQAWLPPRWALLGALIAGCRFAVASSWINTYWGGAVAAAGGAILLGALGRILRSRGLSINSLWINSVLFGLGLAIVAESRPYEGAFFAIPMVLMLGLWFIAKDGPPLTVRLRNVALPLGAVLLVMFGAMAYYNLRVTGNALLLPPALQQKMYGMPETFLWQPPILDAPRVDRYKEIADTFHWQLRAHQTGLTWEVAGARLQVFWRFFIQPVLSIPLLVLPWRTRKSWPWWIALALVFLFAGNSMYPFFFPHYAAPAYPALLLLCVEGLRCLRTVRCFRRPAGAFLSRSLVMITILSAAAVSLGAMFLPGAIVHYGTGRAWVKQQLQEQGGAHLVLVRYRKNHSFDYPIIYNDADIDRSSVIWAHENGRENNAELIKYYGNRDVWIFNPDNLPFKLIPLVGPYIGAVVNGAGLRDDPVQGVSPGSIAVIVGANFIAGGDRILQPRRILPDLPFELAEASEKTGAVFKPAPAGRSGMETAAPAPIRINDLSTEFNNIPAPILSVSKQNDEDALTVQVPFEMRVGPAIVSVHVGRRTARAKVQILPVTPGIFEIQKPDSTRQAIILRDDGSLVDEAHPARRGESLRCLATGLGPLDPSPATNQPVSSPSNIKYSMAVGIHHAGVPFLYARYAKGLIGVEEVGFQVPSDAPSGPNQPFAISVLVNGKMVFGNSSWIPVE